MNPCIIDGLILGISYRMGDAKHHVWISNAYDEKLFLFVDIINNHFPDDWRIRYNKAELIRETKRCFAELQMKLKH
jgi:hypothetical protein